MSVLLLRISAPLQSWGVNSRFSERDTGSEPSKSGILGLICAALGKPRVEQRGDGFPTLSELNLLRMGVRADREGVVSADFHTAGGGEWAGRRYGVAKASGGTPDTVVSRRYYLSDAVFLVALEGDSSLLKRIAAALDQPVWPLFFGRKSCVPAEPVFVAFEPSERSLEDALAAQRWLLDEPSQRNSRRFGDLRRPERLRLVEECFPGENGDVRYDAPLSFASERREHGVRRVRERWTPCPPCPPSPPLSMGATA
jgi:CRISPR system Cascade subunit CasD